MAISTTYLQQGLAEKVKNDATKISLASDANGMFGVNKCFNDEKWLGGFFTKSSHD